ncbi:MAG: MCE family protein [Kiritimatiellae bacterium]|nr:MCE family protein [Kiritimatiellia bacterium]
MAIHANYGKIGFAVLAGTAAMVFALVFIGGMGSRRNELLVETYYENPVSGLSVGSDVNFRGVKVGEVRKISFIGSEYAGAVEKDRRKIFILMAIDTRTLWAESGESPEGQVAGFVKKGLRATVTASGITGLSKIELNYPKNAMAEDEISWRPARVCIPPAPSMLDSFADAAAKFMHQINAMDFTGVWSNVASVASSTAEAAESIGSIVDGQRANIAEIFDNLNAAAANLRDFSAAIRDNPSLLLRENDPVQPDETRR